MKYDKEIASKLKKMLDSDPELNHPSVTNSNTINLELEEHGVWQVVIGRQFVATVSFDAKHLLYFYLDEQEKYILVFRS
jgi:hypothetical protein